MYYLVGTDLLGNVHKELLKMRYMVIFFYEEEATKQIKEFAARERAQGHGVQIRDARTWLGEREECHRAIILPSVRRMFRDKIEAVYGPVVIRASIEDGKLIQPPYEKEGLPAGLPPAITQTENTPDGEKPTKAASQATAAAPPPVAPLPSAGMPSSEAYPQTTVSRENVPEEPQLPPPAEKPRLTMPQRRR